MTFVANFIQSAQLPARAFETYFLTTGMALRPGAAHPPDDAPHRPLPDRAGYHGDVISLADINYATS